jgi:predicted MFS family arabinose efflux permease
MVFTFSVSYVIDYFEATGNMQGSFLFCGIGIFVLMMLHTATLLLSKEKKTPPSPKTSAGKAIGDLFKNKRLMKAILLITLWNVASHITTPFLGTYQIKELGFSMVFISLLTVLYSVSRSLISKPLGRYADRTSFVNMLNVCYLFMAAAFAVNMFTTPENGKLLFSIHYLLYALGCAGITSSEINLIYESVDHEHRMGALALKSTVAGLSGFAASLLVSPLVDYIQKNGNRFWGMDLYAQQVLSAITLLITIGLLIYTNTVMRKK